MNKIKTLSKSRFQLALECPTKLFYYGKKEQYANQKEANEFLMALAEGGFQVGELAKYYHPCCNKMPNCRHDIKSIGYNESIEETSKFINNENVTLYEPVVCFENFLIRVDIFIKNGNKIKLIEVKAKSFDSENGSFRNKKGKGKYINSEWRTYLYDIAFQTWVVKNAFPDYEVEPFLMLVDKKSKTTVNGLNQLFRIKKNKDGRKHVKIMKKVTPELLGEQILIKLPVKEYVEMIWKGNDIDPLKKKTEDLKDFSQRIREYSHHYINDIRFPIKTGSKCKKCEYRNPFFSDDNNLKSGFEECWKHEYGQNYDFEEPHIFELWDYRKSENSLLNGVHFLKDLKYEDLFTSEPKPAIKGMNRIERQWLQINHRTNSTNKDEYIDSKLFQEMKEWNYPLHFIDFETSMVAIPFNKGRRPYEQIAFQFSCHTLYENGNVKHHEWISNENSFPNYDFVFNLRKILNNDNGTIFKYSNHENTVLRQIYRQIKFEKNQIELFESNGLTNDNILGWIDSITNWDHKNDKGKKERIRGNRDMVDLLKCVKMYYYHPMMRGSNSIKQVLPTILNVSEYLQTKYLSPLEFGINLKNMVIIDILSDKKVNDPYKLLKPINIDYKSDDIYLDRGEIRDGGAAMIAYAKLQFTQMDEAQRDNITKALLSYCEMDTLAMVLIFEHWKNQSNKK